ncbi:MAG: UDP-2,3-diacylglucosamine diphosphatase LpxI [Paracoccaceae bacterium]
MLALIAGQGQLPVILSRGLAADGRVFQVYQVAGYQFENPDALRVQEFRLEQVGSLIADLVKDGFHGVCFAGTVRRPQLDIRAIDGATMPLLGRIKTAMQSGDDGALRVLISLFSERGLDIVSPQDIAPDLLARSGTLTAIIPGAQHLKDVAIGQQVLVAQGAADLGQACVVRGQDVIARETHGGTDVMLAGIAPGKGGILFKGPKPDQDRRVDLPTIGLATVDGVARAGLDGIVIVGGGVLILERQGVIDACNRAGLFLHVLEPV